MHAPYKERILRGRGAGCPVVEDVALVLDAYRTTSRTVCAVLGTTSQRVPGIREQAQLESELGSRLGGSRDWEISSGEGKASNL